MIFDAALLKVKNLESIRQKLCGLYILERNVILFSRAGIKKIYIQIPDDCINFYEKKISKYLKQIESDIIINPETVDNKKILQVQSNIFIQQHYIQDEKFFINQGEFYSTKDHDDLFLINTPDDVKKAEKLLSRYIIENTGGFIAQKINKRISIPISLQLSKTRIHPNYLTVLNMIIGFLSSFFVFLCASYNYSPAQIYGFMILGGFLFQAASVLDGVDGEVAKFTLKVSKLGGWLDTFSDNMTLLLFLTATSYLYYFTMGGMISIITILMLFTGLIVMLAVMIHYLSKYSNSGSLVAYDREFLQKLPANDRLVSFALKTKYITKKEMFSIIFFITAFTGHLYLIIPATTFVLLAGAVILTTIHLRYIGSFKPKNTR